MQLPTRDEVKAFRAMHGCSVFAAYAILKQRALLVAAREAGTFEQLRDVVVAMLDTNNEPQG